MFSHNCAFFYSRFLSDKEDDSLSYAFYTVSDDKLSEFEEHDDLVDIEQLQWTIQQAKDDAKCTINHYREKWKRRVDEMFDRLYYDIRDGVMTPPKKYKPKKGPPRKKNQCMMMWEFSFGQV
jgi:hypothetical protein